MTFALIFLYLLPLLIGSGFILTLISLLMINAVSALGLNIIMGYTGQISIGHAAFMSVGAYVTSLLSVKFGIPIFISIPAAVVLATLLGLLLGFPALRIKGFYLAIVTMAFGVAVEQFFGWFEITGGHIGMKVSTKFSDTQGYYLNLTFLIFTYFVVNMILKGRTGRAFMAIRENEIAAECNGVNVVEYKLLSFALGSFLGGLAGALYAHTIGYISPSDFGLAKSLDLLAMVVIGGLGTVGGSLIGATLYTVLPFLFSRSSISTSIIFGALLIITVLLMPRGLFHYLRTFYYSWIEYPFIWLLRKKKKPQYHIVSTEYGKIHYYEHPGTYPYIIMVHGNWGTWKWFKPLLDNWNIENGTIALDLPGFGRSDDLKETISLEAYAKALKNFIEKKKLKSYGIVAHSMGSSVVIKAIKDFKITPSFLLFLSPSPVSGYRTPPEVLPFLRFYSRSISLLKRLIYPSVPGNRRLAREILFEVVRMDPRGFVENAKALEEDLREGLKISSKCKIMRFRNDPLISSEDYNETKNLLNAKEIILEGFGHNPQINCPGVVIREIKEILREV